MRALFVIVASMLSVESAAANLVSAPETMMPLSAGPQLLLSGMPVYSNVTNGPTAAYAQPVGTEIGDELVMTSGGRLQGVSFSVYNSYAAGSTLTQADLTLQFYNHNGGGFTRAGGFTTSNAALGLPPGSYRTLTVNNLGGLGIDLTNDILATLTISNTVGGGYVGQALFDPPTVGSSADAFFRDGGMHWFGGTPVANFCWQIVVPEPASLSLLLFGGLALLRRR